MFKSFFMGMSLQGYIITALIVVILGMGGLAGFQSWRIGNLNQEIGEAKASIELLLSTNSDNRAVVGNLKQELEECANTRREAEERADYATQELARLRREAYMLADERRDEIQDIIQSTLTECTGVAVPPRITELLIEAARSANRGQ